MQSGTDNWIHQDPMDNSTANVLMDRGRLSSKTEIPIEEASWMVCSTELENSNGQMGLSTRGNSSIIGWKVKAPIGGQTAAFMKGKLKTV